MKVVLDAVYNLSLIHILICACTMILPITMVKEQYNFTEEEFNIYLHNHFHSLEEIDKNVNSNKA